MTGYLPFTIHSWLEGTEAVSKSEEVFNSKENRDRWRDKYWDDYRIKWFHKVKAWKHEEEYRAIISNTFGDFEKSEDRNCPYNMNFLKGVIFGINTSEYDKMRIVEAIYKKSDEGKLADDFKFYQAYYDDKTQTIRRREKAGWKIKKRGKS